MSAPFNCPVNGHGVVISQVEADSTDTAITPQDATYGPPTWTIDNTAIAVLIGDDPINVIPHGPVGTVTVTATRKKAGAPDLVGTQVINFTGPVPDHLLLTAVLK